MLDCRGSGTLNSLSRNFGRARFLPNCRPNVVLAKPYASHVSGQSRQSRPVGHLRLAAGDMALPHRVRYSKNTATCSNGEPKAGWKL